MPGSTFIFTDITKNPAKWASEPAQLDGEGSFLDSDFEGDDSPEVKETIQPAETIASEGEATQQLQA
jgi:hypothetical protein